MRTTLVLVGFLVACGGASKDAEEATPPPANDAPAAAVDAAAQPAEPRVSDEAASRTVVDQAVVLFEEMVAAITGAEGDCDQMAADLGAWADASAERRAAVNDQLNAQGQVEEVQQRVGERGDLMTALQRAVQGCQGHTGFMEALNRAAGG